ncbi:hypothetical protein SADUNF_Sadunf16G0017600 [Salix dunnii]|uniref:Uncharacterized protein n=1 Tax=Salix dunnii TaxID=1413687 RepID=A0A835J6M5_9ROSI|nr:hypothetical protein SADUNF_Sadunf16G0017600 [Salix dunnii]
MVPRNFLQENKWATDHLWINLAISQARSDKKKLEKLEKLPTRVFGFSNRCKFPFYNTEFGWWKPVWSSPALKLNRDTKDGEGIAAWIGSSMEDMIKFEQDLASSRMVPSVQAYLSSCL